MPEQNRIRELLAERGEIQFDFAMRAGIAPKTLHNVINGKPTHRSTRRLISQAFGLPEDQVFCHAETYYSSNTDEAQVPA